MSHENSKMAMESYVSALTFFFGSGTLYKSISKIVTKSHDTLVQ